MEAHHRAEFFQHLNAYTKSLKVENEKLKEDKDAFTQLTLSLKEENEKLKEENKFLKELVALHENDDTNQVKLIKQKYNNLKTKIKMINEMFFQDNES